MTQPKAKKAVPAKIVAVDHNIEPIESVVVGDKRSTLGKRLGYFALALLVLFFTINGYIQAAKSNHKATNADHERARLIHSVHHISNTLNTQTKLIKDFRKALRAQNKELRDAGFQTVQIPGPPPTSNPSSGPSSNPRPGPTSSPNPHPGQSPKPKPHPKPTHNPHPKPGPVQQTKDRVCSLTGICLLSDLVIYFQF